MNDSGNIICACGSGLKYKNCCEPITTDSINRVEISNDYIIPDQFYNMIKEHDRKEVKRLQKHGQVKPMIDYDFHGFKFVAVGNRVHYSEKWKTFHDFLFVYIRNILGEEWWSTELKKDPNERHTVLQWFISLCEYQRNNYDETSQIQENICTGTIAAYLSLAYDLYILRHHSLLRECLVKRLLIKEQFQGSRYEVYVASAFVKAGFDIDFEDETDRSISHCEFVATHMTTGNSYSVEAKSRHRPGLLGQSGSMQNPDEIRLRVGRLIRKALRKSALHDRIIFIDINMPPRDNEQFATRWFKPLMKEVIKIENELDNGQKTPPAYLFITNHPYHYAGDEGLVPKKDYQLTAINRPEFIQASKFGTIDPIIIQLWDSINIHNIIPSEFD